VVSPVLVSTSFPYLGRVDIATCLPIQVTDTAEAVAFQGSL